MIKCSSRGCKEASLVQIEVRKFDSEQHILNVAVGNYCDKHYNKLGYVVLDRVASTVQSKEFLSLKLELFIDGVETEIKMHRIACKIEGAT